MLVIDAINDMIGMIGESPIDATDPDYTEHPLYESALRILNRASEDVQGKGWWFNTARDKVLSPSGGTITLAADVLTVQVTPTFADTHDYTIRDGKLYDLTDDTATINDDVTAVVRTLVAFEDLPATAAAYIAARATTRFVKTYDGGSAKVNDAESEEKLAFIPFNTDEIRNARVNMFQTTSMGPILANNWYSRYRQR